MSSPFDYEITKTNGTLFLNPDGTPLVVPALGNINGLLANSSTSLDLIGKGSYEIANAISNSFIRLSENFADVTPPNNPQSGQLWFNTSTQALNVFANGQWGVVGNLSSGLNHNVTLTLTGDVSGTATSNFTTTSITVPITLATVNSTPGSFTGANITVDAKGRITSVSSGAFAPINSPIFTGNPQAPTPGVGNNSASLATTAFVQAALGTINLSPYALINSPNFTGQPTGPTPPAGDNSARLATTSFVQTAINNNRPNLAPYALINSPNFTGQPTAPTPGAGDFSNDIATTAFVQTALNSINLSAYATQAFVEDNFLSSSSFSGDLQQNGWFKFPGGLILQWGYMVGPYSEQVVTVNLPTSFPNGCFVAYADVVNGSANIGISTWMNVVSLSSSSVNFLVNRNQSNNPNIQGFMWLAIGN